jgi:hypothetical protein
MPFRPTDLSGLTLWLHAAAVALADAQPVAAWPDSSGAGLNFGQAEAARRPTLRTNVVGGQPVVRFDGVDDVLSAGSVAGSVLVGANEATVFCVQKQAGAKAQNTTLHWIAPDDTNRFGAHLSYENTLIFDFGNVTAGGRVGGAQPAGWDDAFKIVSLRRLSGGAGAIRVGGADAVTGTFTDALDNTQSAPLFVGGMGAEAVSALQGDLAELIVYNRGLSDAERTQVYDYLNAKYFTLGPSPSKTVHRFGETPPPLFTALQAARWTTTSGVLLTSASPRTVYNGTDYRTTIYLEPANETRQVTVTATTAGAEVGQATIRVYGTFPLSPEWGYKLIVEEPAVISLAEDKVTAKVRYKGDPVDGFEFTILDRELAEDVTFAAFRAHHRIDLPWYFTDPETGTSYKLRFDQLRFEGERFNDRNNRSVLARKYSGGI